MTSKFSIDNRELLQRISSGEAVVGIDFGNLIVRELAAFRLAAMDSESECLPLDYLQGHKDGLEWAAQLAEANHPETGDWLYDDPIELAKAIRKGPDMPPAQPVADSDPVIIVGDDGGDALSYRRLIQSFEPGTKLYRHAQQAPVAPAVSDDIGEIRVGRLPTMNQDDYPGLGDWWVQLRIGEDSDEVLARVYGATPQEANNRAEALACRAAMLHAGNSPAQSDCCPAQNSVVPAQSGNSPAIPDGYVLVPKEATKGILDEFDSIIDYGAEDSVDAWHRLLAAATQEVKP
ncbi:Uncharacterised protein [Klebsiella pneumoniae]|uniref:DUF551 domain-containing protein n=1 Tax=Klebsiella pneumoniae TaxID=573 RepID=UPI0007CD181B|nr:Uncharacterised protein [Klebsiella pneumoniae]SAU98469.1 Uncharacterised protein [Klebsiella pneumoniae]